MKSSIEALWTDLARVGSLPAHRRVEADHPLDLYAEISADGRPGLLVISSDEPPSPPPYEAVEVRLGRRVDGRWALSVILARRELEPLFSRLCEDIIEAGRSIRPESRGAEFVLSRLARWRRLLNLGHNDVLADGEIRGLIGELLFLKTAIPLFGPHQSVVGWNGPFEASQDFELPSGLYEIKAVRPGAVTVRVSSLDQLDVAHAALTLVVYVLSGDSHGGTGFTLAELVGEIQRLLGEDEVAGAEFQARLTAAGYVDRPEYGKTGYRVVDTRFYLVSTDFPRLTRSRLPHAFSDATYELFLAACEPFRVEPPRT